MQSRFIYFILFLYLSYLGKDLDDLEVNKQIRNNDEVEMKNKTNKMSLNARETKGKGLVDAGTVFFFIML